MPGRLILCSSPIGNLGDTTERLADALRSADVLLAEDTRRARFLLDHLGVSVESVVSFFAGNEHERLGMVKERLEGGATVALLTDAGTPSVSDPGLSAVRAALDVGAKVEAVPGPSAVTMALVLSGLPADRFAFDGFLSRKGRGRSDRLQAIAQETRTVVLFASPKRLANDLLDLEAALGGDRRIAVCREMTKLHEEVWRGTLSEAVEHWSERTIKGEVTLVIEGAPAAEADLSSVFALLELIARSDIPTGEIAKTVAATTGLARNLIYDEVTKLRRS